MVIGHNYALSHWTNGHVLNETIPCASVDKIHIMQISLYWWECDEVIKLG
jgi:hypothetical protein